eukprot:scaffold28389_cov50-Phaeocystis_antarctica.AAC.1
MLTACSTLRMAGPSSSGMTVGASFAATGRTVSTTPPTKRCQLDLPSPTFAAASAISSFLAPGRPPTGPPSPAADAVWVEKRRPATRRFAPAARIIFGDLRPPCW